MTNIFKWMILSGMAMAVTGLLYNQYFFETPTQGATAEAIQLFKNKQSNAAALVLTGLIAFTIGIMGQMKKRKQNKK